MPVFLRISSNSGYKHFIINRSENKNSETHSVIVEDDFRILGLDKSFTRFTLADMNISDEELREFIANINDFPPSFYTEEFSIKATLKTECGTVVLTLSRDDQTEGRNRGLANLEVRITRGKGSEFKMVMSVDEITLRNCLVV